MNELCRILQNRKRLALLLGLVAVCVVMYVFHRTGNVRMDYWWLVAEQNAQLRETVESFKGLSPEEVYAAVTEELDALEPVQSWAAFPEWEDLPREEAVAILEKWLPDAVPLVDDARALLTAISNHESPLRTVQEQAEYQMGYTDYLAGIQQQALLHSQTSVFGDPLSFSNRNLQKTAEEFSKLDGVRLEFGNNQAVESFASFETADYLYLIALVAVVMAFLEERKKGLWSTVRSCKNGRLMLGLSRLGILALSAVVFALIFYGLPLAMAFAIDGGMDGLGRPLQSLMSFKTCAIRTTIGGWLVQYFIVKMASGFFVGLLLWCILGRISSIQFSVAVLCGVLAGEYILFTTFPLQSALNPLKYFNIFSYIRTAALYTDYLNIDLFGYPVGIRPLALAALPVLTAGLAVLALLTQRNRYPEGNRDILGRIAGVWRRVMDVPRRHLSIGGMEGYKAFVLELSVLLLAALFIVSGTLRYTQNNNTSYGSNSWYRAYYFDTLGPIDESTDEYMERAKVLAGLDENFMPTDDTVFDAGQISSALIQLQDRIDTLKERAAARNYDPWLIDPDRFDSLFGRWASDVQHINAAVAALFVMLCSAGIFAYEHKQGVVPMLRSTKRGRRAVFRRKVAAAVVMAVLVWAFVYVREILQHLEQYGTDMLASPVQNMESLKDFPLIITIGQYIGLLAAIRLVMLVMVSFAALWISDRARSMEAAYMLCLGAVGIPSVVYTFGISVLGWFCPVPAVGAAEALMGLTTSSLASALPWLEWTALGIAALVLCRRQWVK